MSGSLPIPPVSPTPMVAPTTTFIQEVSKDFWIHIGGLVAVGFAVVDHFFGGSRSFGDTTDLLLLAGGLAAQGVKILNGTAAAAAASAAASAIDTANVVATALAARQATTAAVAAKVVTDTAASTADTLGHPPTP